MIEWGIMGRSDRPGRGQRLLHAGVDGRECGRGPATPPVRDRRGDGAERE
jgi:hypothetical protein